MKVPGCIRVCCKSEEKLSRSAVSNMLRIWGIFGGLFGENGKEHGNYYNVKHQSGVYSRV